MTENRQNFERIKLYDQQNGSEEPRQDSVEYTFPPRLSAAGLGTAASPDPALSVILTDVLLPILERLNGCLDELERVVVQIAEAPHG